MSRVVNSLDKALERFEKTVDTSFAGPVPNSLLARQDLEPAIVVLSDRLTPFRDRVTRIKGEGLAHLWNQRTSLTTLANGPQSLVNLFYADGNLPPSIGKTPDTKNGHAAYILLDAKGRLQNQDKTDSREKSRH